jgi:hypothetical protein
MQPDATPSTNFMWTSPIQTKETSRYASAFDDTSFWSNTSPLKDSSVSNPSAPKYLAASILSEDATVSTWGEDSVFPSIGHDANLADIFAEELEMDQRGKSVNKKVTKSASQSPASTARTDTTTRSGSSVKKLTPPRSEISHVIERFGGKAKSYKKSAVQIRREELEKKWAADRLPTHRRKVKWSSNNGTYKKQVTLDYSGN